MDNPGAGHQGPIEGEQLSSTKQSYRAEQPLEGSEASVLADGYVTIKAGYLEDKSQERWFSSDCVDETE